MTKKLLVIASSLLFIVGCESELDRCIEVNEKLITETLLEDPSAIEFDYYNDSDYLEIVERLGQLLVQRAALSCSIEEFNKGDASAQCEDLIEESISLVENTEEFRKPAIAKKAEEACNSQGVY